MKKKRNDSINLFLKNAKIMKTHSYSLNTRNKYDKIISTNSKKDSKKLFKNYYKSKNSNKNNIKVKDSFNDINYHYLKSQNTILNYFRNKNNQFGLKIEGNKSLENFSLFEISNYIDNTCSQRESILRKKLLNYFYPKDNINKLMGKEMALTPIPYKKNIFIKTSKEKDDYLKAQKSAVFMRRLEYNYGLKDNKTKKNNNKKIDFLQILKGAVEIIEDWWIKILNRKKKIKLEKELLENRCLTERQSMSSIEINIEPNLETQNSESINSIYAESLIDKWITSQIKSSILNKIKNSKENFDKKNLIFLSLDKNKNNKNFETNKIRNTNNITVFKPNKKKNETISNNQRYNYFENYGKNNYEKESIKTEINPIKLMDNYNKFSLNINSKEETTISPSDYLQKNFKRMFSKENKISDNSSSKGSLHELELLQKKYKKMNTNSNDERFFTINTTNNFEESLYKNFNSNENSINKIKNAKNKSNNRIDKEKIKIIERKKRGNNSISNSNQSKSKNITSDIEPIKKDDKINIDINNNILKLQKNLQKKKNNYNIRYNITKCKSLNENKIFDKSSMDGSVDEIITKKLKEFYDNDIKYSQRINKVYNQVKSSRFLSCDGKNNLNSQKFKNKNFFNSLDDE